MPTDDDEVELQALLQFVSVATELTIALERFVALADKTYPLLRRAADRAHAHQVATNPEQPPAGHTQQA